MSARYCDRCDCPWPTSQDYAACPQCSKRTTFDPYAHPLDDDDAVSRRKHAEFERRYAEHDQQRIREGRLSPEAEGRLEARKLIEQTKKLEAQVAYG